MAEPVDQVPDDGCGDCGRGENAHRTCGHTSADCPADSGEPEVIRAAPSPGTPEPVPYIGSGQLELRARLGKEFYVGRGSCPVGPGTRAHEWPDHARTLAARSSFAYAVTEDGGTAKTREKRLLQHSLRLTGLVPIVNGGDWWNNDPLRDRTAVVARRC